MSLKPSIIEPVPEKTACLVRAAFPKGNLYIKPEIKPAYKITLLIVFESRSFIPVNFSEVKFTYVKQQPMRELLIEPDPSAVAKDV